jgi:hypothetical protein
MPASLKLPLLATIPMVFGLAVSTTATAETLSKTYEYSAADACQLSIPTTDTKVRPKASGYRNEGSTSQFVICGMGGYEHGTVDFMALIATSMDGQPHTMTCTGVTGIVGLLGPFYSTKSVDVPAVGAAVPYWAAEDFGGPMGSPIPAGLNLSVTCTLPPNVALQGFESQGEIDVGE